MCELLTAEKAKVKKKMPRIAYFSINLILKTNTTKLMFLKVAPSPIVLILTNDISYPLERPRYTPVVDVIKLYLEEI